MYGFAPIELLLGAEALGAIFTLRLFQRLLRFGFRGSGFGNRVSVLGFRYYNFGFPVSDCGATWRIC